MQNNVTPPIFSVDVSTPPVVSSPQRVRVMGGVDMGDSTIPVGTSVVITDKEDLAVYMPISSVSYQKAAKYFDNLANDQRTNTLTVINVGAPVVTPGTASQMVGLATSFTPFASVTNGSFVMTIGATNYTVTGLDFSLVASLQDVANVINSNTTFNAIASALVVGTSIEFVANQIGSSFTFSPLTSAGIGTNISGVGFLEMGVGQAIITTGTDTTSDYSGCLVNLQNYFADNSEGGYPFFTYVPTEWVQGTTATAFKQWLTDLRIVTEYAYFAAEYPNSNIANDLVYQSFMGLPNLMMFLKSKNAEQYNDAAVVGVASRYVPSTAYQMTSLNLSDIIGVDTDAYTTNQKQQFKLYHLNYASAYQGVLPVVTLGVFMDGNIYTNRYGVAATKFYTESLVNSYIKVLHDDTQPLTYDQTGIDTLLGVIETALTTAVSWGVIDRFTNLKAIAYSIYAATYPFDVQDGIYNGYSANIGRRGFFASVKLNLQIVI